MRTLRKLTIIFSSVCVATLFCISTTLAQENSEMDQYIQEFFIGETVFPQEKKEIQFTLKPVLARRPVGQQVTLPFEIEYGLSNRFQVSIELPYLLSFPKETRTMGGLGEAELSLMYTILNKNHPFGLSVGAALPLHTTRAYFKEEDEPVFETFALIGRQFEHIQVHGNLVSEFTRTDMVFNYGISSLINFGRLNASLELCGNKEEERTYRVSPGLIWHHSEGFEFGVAVYTGLPAATKEWGLMSMITWEFSISRSKNKHGE